MAHVVYHANWDGIIGMDTEPLRDYFVDNALTNIEVQKNDFRYCPAFNDFFKNIFVVKSHYQYELEWDGNTFKSSMYDQNFFDRNILIRDIKHGIFTYRSPNPVFFTESESLIISQEPPYLHDNDINNCLSIIPGKYDIGKHLPRPLELAGKYKKPGVMKINEGDGLYYVRFHTNEKIIFKKFVFSQQLRDFIKSNFDVRFHNKGLKSLRWWYDFVSRNNLKKYFLSEIKKNLL